MNGDGQLTQEVTEQLHWDPKLDSRAIGVAAEDGRVLLRGTVGSLRERHEAKNAAQRVFGVVSVDNQIEVRPLLNDRRRDDADVRGDVLRALMLDSVVPDTVDAHVREGVVTLTGTAEKRFERDEAVLIASSIVGARDVVDEIELRMPVPWEGDVRGSIELALERNAKLDAERLEITTSDGTVTICGTVRSWAEHEQAIDAVWAAPGVRAVEDRLTVSYEGGVVS